MKKLWNYEDYVRHLSHSSKLIRKRAFEVFGKKYANKYTDEVLNLIGDEDSYLASMAPRYLAKHRAVQHGPKILECFNSSKGNVACNCAKALGTMAYEPAIDAMLEGFSYAEDGETFFGILEYLGKVKFDDARAALRAVVFQMHDNFFLSGAVRNLLLHRNPEDVPFVLDKFLGAEKSDFETNSFLRAIAIPLGADSFFDELSERGSESLLQKPDEVLGQVLSQIPAVSLPKRVRADIVKSLSGRALEDLATMITFDARSIFHERYAAEDIPVWLADMYCQDSMCLALFEEMSRHPSIWDKATNTNRVLEGLAALLLAVYFSLKEKSLFVQAISPAADLDDWLRALAHAGPNFPAAIQNKIKGANPVPQLNAALSEGLVTWGDIWTIRLMGQIGSCDFIPALVRVLKQADFMEHIYSDALSALKALEESADEGLLAAVRSREIGTLESFSLLGYLPYAEAYDLALELWEDERDRDLDSFESFVHCLEGIGDRRGLERLRKVYAEENDADYIGRAIEYLALLYDEDIPELPEIRRRREEREKRQQAREEELNEMARNYRKKSGSNTLLGQVVPFKRSEAKVGRNDPCPCGSGEKYKKCCLKKQ